MEISQHHRRCILKFQALCALAEAGMYTLHPDDPDMRDELDRYVLWSGNVGAFHSGNTFNLSLDYRLREASFYRDQVIRLLGLLERHLPSQSENDGSTAGLPRDPDSVDDTSSWGISSDSESEANSIKIGKHITLDSSLELSEPASRLSSVLRSIQFTISCLYQLPIRRPAPVNRIRNDSANEVTFYEFFDVLYVKDKFPGLEQEVAIRLGRMITKRRQLLLYRKHHRDSLQPGTLSEPSVEVVHRVSNTRERGIRAHSEGRSESTIKSLSQATHTQISSKATTLHTDQIAEKDELHIPESRPATSVAASEYTQNLRIHVPPRPAPKLQTGSRMMFFECNYCRLLPTITSDLAWRRHVLADLQPYVCTFSDCNVPYHFFSSRDAWFEHETHNHRLELFCNTRGHKSFQELDKFSRHMRDYHGVNLDRKSSATLLHMFERPSHASEGICKLCMKPTKKLKLHVARHLEQLCLFAIPRADYTAGDEDAKDDSNVSQKNVEGSSEEEPPNQDVDSTSSFSEDINVHQVDSARLETEVISDEYLQDTSQVPDGDATIWDTVTDKFTQARLGLSAPAPIDSIIDPDQSLDDLFQRSRIQSDLFSLPKIWKDIERRYNYSHVNQGEFFKPPELWDNSQPSIPPPDPNSDADITFWSSSEKPTSVFPSVNVTTPSPPTSPHIEPTDPVGPDMDITMNINYV
ncbi:hypothetical protein K469DRAFT_346469 [Zopfia rhizophila CBS 207.26]|uniref:Oxidoreductase acuF-like C2H2 type zinc-finger domain-containing protein n=1 Tax=Zopfia rhizophila CBS 207.26 TaxID=1314779 RepID=A0A6A6EK65_9PEZI|nr:hypothetical protein K469DRAFT_346469 [Zopfia rhizophila CBS 207.26]